MSNDVLEVPGKNKDLCVSQGPPKGPWVKGRETDRMRFELMVPKYVIFQVWCIKPLCHMSLIMLWVVVGKRKI